MGELLHQLLSASAAAHPDRVAVVDGGRRLTYRELEARANRLAGLLLDVGVARGARVGLFLDKSLEALVGIYGVLKSGAAYVPFDPQAPAARLAHIALDAGIRCVVSGSGKEDECRALLAEGAPVETLVMLDGEQHRRQHGSARVVAGAEIEAHPESPPDVQVDAGDLAYVLYTSGSTGRPKGVMLSHLNAMTFVDWAAEAFHLTPADRLSSHAPLHFDLSIFDLFAAASAGASVVLVPPGISVFPPQLARFIERAELSVWYSVPSALSMLALRGRLESRRFPHLRAVLFAGEVLPVKYLVRLMDALPHARLYNLYGPTETNVCTWYEVPRPFDPRRAAIPIGRAISNVEVFAVKDDGAIARPGEVGELCVRGPSVMQGYWGDPERTARVLRPVPSAGPGPAYHTGDLAREDEDGSFLFLGRRDAQIKSRGHRIELGDIESALHADPAVVECAVTAIPDEVFTNRIKAYVVVKGEVDASDVIASCSRRLPRYMVPDVVELRDALPRTSTGKVDTRALAAAGAGAGDVAAADSPRAR